METLKGLVGIFEKDMTSGEFSRAELLAYGVAVPLAMVAVALLAGIGG